MQAASLVTKVKATSTKTNLSPPQQQSNTRNNKLIQMVQFSPMSNLKQQQQQQQQVQLSEADTD